VLQERATTRFVAGYLGALWIGATVVLAHPSSTEDELRYLAADSGAAVGIASEERRERLGVAVPVVDILAGADVASSPEPVAAALDGSTRAVLAYTSGTTGRPKGVPLSHANLATSIRAAMAAWGWSADDVVVHALPLAHQHGLGGLHTALIARSRAVILDRFDPVRLDDVARAEGATVLMAVPAMYERLVSSGLEPTGLARVRLAISGSAALSDDLFTRVSAWLGQPPLERYGTTESGLDVSNPLLGPRRPGFVGLALPGVELRLGDDHGEAVAPGEEGEVLVRGPQCFSGYLRRPEADAEAFWPGGWFRTGDVGRQDPSDGYLAIVGRRKELIVSGGYNVYPAEVERVLRGMPGVAEVAVAGVPSERWGEQVSAFVVRDPAGPVRSAEELIALAREQLAPYKCPKQVVFVTELPKSSLGKVRRAELAALATDDPEVAARRAVEHLWRGDVP